MGRRKITIKQIVDPKLRHITFNKRKNGLIKKAAELSLLCNINMLLIFEDGNGNLIQFSKNKLVDIPSFFRECRYTNVLEFIAKDYPHFFKVNHYKKQKGRDDDDEDLDDLDDASDINPQTTLSQSGSQTKTSNKRDRVPIASRIKEEDRNSGKMVFQSGSDESSNEGNYDMGAYNNNQAKAPLQPQQRIQIKTSKPKPIRPEEKQKIVTEDDVNLGLLNDQEPTPVQKDSFQNYKDMTPRIRPEKTVDFNAPFMNFEHSFKRTNSIADTANTPFRFYPTDTPLNAPNASTNTYVNNPNFANPHPFIHNGYQTPTNNFQNNAKNNRMRGFGPLNMGNIPNEEALNAMLKGFPPLGFALGGGNPFMNKPSSKPEMDEKLLETANMIKLINGTAGANPYAGQKMYGFHPNEAGKPEDNEQMANLRNREAEGAGFDHEHEYHEMPYMRGEYRMEGNMPQNIPSNLPSAYFSSKKFNFDGYFNTFEDDRFNEFGDSKKKIKP